MILTKLDLKNIVKGVCIFLLIWGIVTTTYTRVIAAPEKKAEIIEKAKREGKVVLYSGTNISTLEKIRLPFEKKYPFLKINTFRAGSAKLAYRAQSEYRAGRYLADIYNPSLWGAYPFFKEKMVGVYKSPERKSIQEFAKDRDGYWTCDYINVGVIAYNTKLVPPDKMPKSYHDFLDPWWKGKIVIDSTNGLRWYGLMLEVLGEEKGRSFMLKISGQDINVRRGMTLQSQLLAAGEFSAFINASNSHIELLKTDGAPIEWIAPIDQPTIPTPHVITIAKKAPHPNAAKLYIDFVLSKEGQQIFAGVNRIPSRVDVSPNPSRLMRGADGKRINILAIDSEFVVKVLQLQGDFEKLFISAR